MDGTFVYRRRVALDAMPCFAVHRHEGLSSPIDKALRNKQGRAKRATLLLQKELLLFVICLFLLSFMFINLLCRPLSPSFSLPLVSEEFIHHTAMSVKLTQVKRRIICKLDLLAEISNVWTEVCFPVERRVACVLDFFG